MESHLSRSYAVKPPYESKQYVLCSTRDPLHTMTIQLLNRRPPFGSEVLAAANEMPDFQVKVVDETVKTFGGKKDIECTLTIECSCTVQHSKQKRRKQKTSLGPASVITLTSDDAYIDFRRIGSVGVLVAA